MNDCPKDCHKKAPFIFGKVVIPAAIDDDSKNPPKNGAYCNMLVVYAATGNAYLYDSAGIPTRVTTDLGDIDRKISTAVGAEADARIAADQEIWTEIETIEAASDVVDVVGTYAELQAYDTSKLKNNDLIKVLADETRGGAITYYRWSTTTHAFSYVGSEGPYYTASETDTLLAGKQDKLIAGTNIQIAADGKTISATDTTYSPMTGATSGTAGVAGLVPAPAAGDQNKALKGDGTWGEVASGTIFYMNAHDSGSTRNLYKSSNMTGLVTMQDIIDANNEGQVIVRISTSSDPATYSDMYLQNAYVASGDYQMIFLDNQYYYSFDSTQTSANTFQFAKRQLQDKLTAGTNITINGNTISATDTTYTHFTGATALDDGVQGLVPGPLAGDQDKFLKADGTWATVSGGGGGTVTTFYWDDSGGAMYKDNGYTDLATYSDISTAMSSGVVYIQDATNTSDYTVVADDHYNFRITAVANISSANTISVFAYDSMMISWSRTDTEVQPKLTAGANISISTVNNVPNTISVTGMPVLYGSQGQNTDGAVTQKLFTDTVGDVESILQILNSGAGV